MAPSFVQHPAGSREAWGAALTYPPRHAAASADVDLKEVLNEMQSEVYHRGVRVKDCFADFDPLRSGRCTPSQFVRGVNRIVPSLKVSDGEALADHYTEKGPLVKVPQIVNYQKTQP
ncbi:unnamed protein product [Prorocentrum cordatum]|uniref:EF-hand domain-containing protein n=1 Tax=Prorocentrum cordatum TaxID=2364126 RepID=A0ABN9TIA2_9DINO|nr:unnamed protein product [Polarella glacialis]